MIATIVTVSAFFQALSWPIAGVVILVSLVLPLLASFSPQGVSMTFHPTSKIPATIRHSQTDTKSLQHRPSEKHTTSNHQSSTKVDQRPSQKPDPVKTLPKVGPKLTGSLITAPKLDVSNAAPLLRSPTVKQGPNFNPTIAKGDYAEYDIELDSGKDFSGEVKASGLVNIYLLDEDNLDKTRAKNSGVRPARKALKMRDWSLLHHRRENGSSSWKMQMTELSPRV
jgi:hypothetical protein